MREFFHEKLQWPIEFFNPLRNVAVADRSRSSEVAQSAHLLGELVGLALRSTITCPMELNLRPANVVRRHELAQRRPFFVVAARLFRARSARLGLLFPARRAASKRASPTRCRSRSTRCAGLKTRSRNLSKETAALDAAATPLAQRDQRSRRLAAHSR